MIGLVSRLTTKIWGAPLGPGATRLERLRYRRRMAYLSTVPPFVVGGVLIAILYDAGVELGFALVFGVLWLVVFATTRVGLVVRLATKIWGAAPEPSATRVERLRYVRRIAYLGTTLPMLVVGIPFLAILYFNWVLALVPVVPWLVGFAAINLQIRRERRQRHGHVR